MNLTTECCTKCGVPLFEENGASKGRKIFRSFGTKTIEGKELYFCYACYEHLNDKFFEGEKANDEQREDD